MHSLIYINKEVDSVEGLIYNLAEEYVSKLTFTTREEYLSWVKQWKEDVKIVTLYHTQIKYCGNRNACIRQEKIDYWQKKLDKLPSLSDEQKKRVDELMQQYLKDYNLKDWFKSSHYLFWYMLIVRKASKLRAKAQRELRLQTAA